MSTQDFNPQPKDNQITFLDRIYAAIHEQAARMQDGEDAILNALHNLVEELRGIAQRTADDDE